MMNRTATVDGRSSLPIAIAAIACATAAIPSTAKAQAIESELHTFNCLHGCPVGAPETNDIVVREIYTLSSNDLTKLAD